MEEHNFCGVCNKFTRCVPIETRSKKEVFMVCEECINSILCDLWKIKDTIDNATSAN